MGKWARAFSQVVADGRFSVLGLVVLACLAGVCRVVGVLEGLEVLGQREVERVLEEFGGEVWGEGGNWSGSGGFGDVGDRVGGVGPGEAFGERVARVDEGEVVAREEDDEVEGGDRDRGLPITREEGEEVPRGRHDGDDERSNDDDEEPARPTKPTQQQQQQQQLSPSPPPKVAKTKRTSTKKRSTTTDTTDTTDSKPKPAKKKRKKGGDAIDDLFSGW